MFLSVIVPVYNVEKYLRECLDSILASGIRDMEVIAVNDGSTDSSPEILREYEGRITVISQENRGLSAARNAGIRRATGKYIAFVDSDDRLCPDSFFEMAGLLASEECDIMVGDYRLLDEASGEVRDDTLHKMGADCLPHSTGPLFLKKYYRNASSVVWRSIYRREMIVEGGLPFHEGICYEDVEWSIRVYHRAGDIRCCHIPFYLYRTRKGSIVNSPVGWKKAKDAMSVCDTLLATGAVMQDRQIRKVYERNGLHCAVNILARGRGSYSDAQKAEIRGWLKGKKCIDLKYRLILAGLRMSGYLTM